MKRRLFSPVLILATALPALPQTPAAVFRAEARLVQVYATVIDHRGRYVDGIPRERFRITDEGQPQPIVAFESNASELSCAILLDTTGSMRDALPAVKNAVSRLIDEFRDDDSVAVYAFSSSLELLQDFTTDKAAARRAMLRTRALGATALFDALTRVTVDIAARSGKKALVVFTDGDDNASVLNAQRVVDQAKKSGIPVYAVAEGDALRAAPLLNRLREIATLSGGRIYSAKDAREINKVFQDISDELQHTYLLTYRPPETHGQNWRQIQVSLADVKDCTVRSKEGYFPD